MKASLYDGSFADCLGYLSRRAVLLLAKLVGFKGFCLFLATLLLCLGKVGEDVWLTLLVTLVCSASGIRVLDSFKEGADVLDAKNFISAKLGKLAKMQGVYHETKESVATGLGCLPFLSASGAGNAGGNASRNAGPAACGDGRDDSRLDAVWARLPEPAGGQPGGASGPAEPVASGAAVKKAARKGKGVNTAAKRRAGDKGRERIRAVLEEASKVLER